ncbi:MAG: 50S ribosomal protein L6, partial [Candidatus Micrarchaeota archaeon]|nr:50S ribosomal protein L6 [Candidatus Micrarchaeota archaeon]
PTGISVSVGAESISVKGPKGEVQVSYPRKKVSVKVEGNKISITGPKVLVNTQSAHIRNAFTGVTSGHKQVMKAVFAHFPMKIEVKGDTVYIKNFLGEKTDRVAKIEGETKVVVKGQDVEIEGPDIYAVGQTAANLRQATKVKTWDDRIFQDGIYKVRK